MQRGGLSSRTGLRAELQHDSWIRIPPSLPAPCHHVTLSQIDPLTNGEESEWIPDRRCTDLALATP